MVKIIATAAEWEALMETSKTKPVIVDFFAEWCGPCKMIAPTYAKAAEDNADIEFAKVDVDNEELETIVGAQGVSAMPTFIVYKDGKAAKTVTGASKDKIDQLVAAAKE